MLIAALEVCYGSHKFGQAQHLYQKEFWCGDLEQHSKLLIHVDPGLLERVRILVEKT